MACQSPENRDKLRFLQPMPTRGFMSPAKPKPPAALPPMLLTEDL